MGQVSDGRRTLRHNLRFVPGSTDHLNPSSSSSPSSLSSSSSSPSSTSYRSWFPEPHAQNIISFFMDQIVILIIKMIEHYCHDIHGNLHRWLSSLLVLQCFDVDLLDFSSKTGSNHICPTFWHLIANPIKRRLKWDETQYMKISTLGNAEFFPVLNSKP